MGVCLGSFLNVLIDRLSLGESVVKGRSHCDFCKHTLAWFDLIPLLSFVMIGGHCRYCRKKLSMQYPLMEIITGALFVTVGFFVTDSLILLSYWITILSCLLVITGADLKYHIIPDEILIVLLLVTLLFGVLYNPEFLLLDHLIAGFALFLFFLILVIITKGRGMGLGDVKYAFFMGLFLGEKKSLIGFYIAFLTGALFSLILMIGGRARMKSVIPFGPFLVLATIVSSLYGDALWKVFLKIIGL